MSMANKSGMLMTDDKELFFSWSYLAYYIFYLLLH